MIKLIKYIRSHLRDENGNINWLEIKWLASAVLLTSLSVVMTTLFLLGVCGVI